MHDKKNGNEQPKQNEWEMVMNNPNKMNGEKEKNEW